MRRVRGAAKALAAIAFVLVVSACAGVVNGSGTAPVARRSSSSPSAAPSSSASPAAPNQSGSIPAGPEFSAIRYDIPDGFTATTGFTQNRPLEPSIARRFYVTPAGHTDGTAGVISIIVYDLPTGLSLSTASAQTARVAYYNKLLKVRVTAALRPTKLAGRTAYTESVIEPPNFVYSSWYLFGKTHVLQVNCQFGAAATNVSLTMGCDQLVESLQTN